MDKITVFLIFLMWAILLLNRFYFNKKNNYFRNFNDKILFDGSFYKLKIYNVSLIFGYILLGFNYLNLKLFLIHLAVFVLATIKLNKNSQDSSNSKKDPTARICSTVDSSDLQSVPKKRGN